MKYTTQLCGDYFINHKDSVIKQPGFNGKYPAVFSFFVAHVGKVDLDAPCNHHQHLVQGYRTPNVSCQEITCLTRGLLRDYGG